MFICKLEVGYNDFWSSFFIPCSNRKYNNTKSRALEKDQDRYSFKNFLDINGIIITQRIY